VTFEDVRAELARAAILLDFDGTLAPIVDDPAAARPVPDAANVLRELVARAAVVAVITGRPASFVQDLLDVPGLEVIGLYGLEASPPVEPGVLATIREMIAPFAGAGLEDKGASVAVHVRRTADPDAAAAALRPLLQALADARDLRGEAGDRARAPRHAQGGRGPRGARTDAARRRALRGGR
jgi:trehalose 6-phosphate phosphatase